MVGSRVRVRLPINLCAGEPSWLFVGVLRNSSSESWKSRPSALDLRRRFLTVCTAFSTFPFDCG